MRRITRYSRVKIKTVEKVSKESLFPLFISNINNAKSTFSDIL
jgi:hypothetical protein